VLDFFSKLFSSDFMPHVYCLRQGDVIWLHVIADALIALAYLSIPVSLVNLVRSRKDLAFSKVFFLFGMFILACGATHLLSIVTLWHPIYRFEGVVKAITAVASVLTAIVTYRLLPVAIALPSAATLQERVDERTAELAVSNARFRAATEAVGDVLWTNDAGGRLTGEQPGWSKLTGQTREQYEGLGWSAVVHPDDAQPTVDEWNRSVAERRPFVFEHRLRRHDGVWRRFAIRAVPVFNADGSIQEWVGVHRDITEQREHEIALQEARTLAESASRAKSTFLASMSHELRTPLNAIIGYSEMLSEQAAHTNNLSAVKDLETIQLAGKHLLSLINSVLDLSKIEAGKIEMCIGTFSPGELAQSIRTLLDPLAEANGNRLIIDVAPGLGEMRSDEAKVRQTLINLIGNAIKFTRNGEIKLSIQPRGGTIVFTVTDTGIGMDAEQYSRIFDAFTQAELNTAQRFGGTGLGLAISKHFVELLGGTISCTSEKGVGSCFTVILPFEIQTIAIVS
jgi:PAS domain S-box-containing protein